MISTLSERDAQQHQFPPSLPPSPPAMRLKHRKKVDPFDQLGAIPATFSPPSPPNEPADKESLLRNLILTPLLFISFLLSLFLVNLGHRSRRQKEHSKPSSIPKLQHPSSWLDPEPYQHPDNASWSRRDSAAHVEPHDAISPKEKSTQGRPKQEPWHLKKKIRKITKLEISDAFELRGRVLFGMVLMMAMSFAVICTSLRWLFVQIPASLSDR